MAKKSFRDPSTHILKCWGYTETNQPGDLSRDEPDSFELKPGEWRLQAGEWVAVPQSELDATVLAGSRATAQSLLSQPQVSQYTLLRAVIMTLIDELNILRDWTVDFKVEVAAASSLANLQTRVATLPTLADRTPTQARNAILAKIDTGTVDS